MIYYVSKLPLLSRLFLANFLLLSRLFLANISLTLVIYRYFLLMYRLLIYR